MSQYNRLVEAYKDYNLQMERNANSKNIKAGSVIRNHLNQKFFIPKQITNNFYNKPSKYLIKREVRICSYISSFKFKRGI